MLPTGSPGEVVKILGAALIADAQPVACLSC